jgi:hypothetical protein
MQKHNSLEQLESVLTYSFYYEISENQWLFQRIRGRIARVFAMLSKELNEECMNLCQCEQRITMPNSQYQKGSEIKHIILVQLRSSLTKRGNGTSK